MMTLTDYPAVAPAETQRHIDTFRASCIRVRETSDQHRKRACITLASRHADQLRARRDELETLLTQGDRWLAQHPDDDDEAAWFEAESEYRAIVDALESGARVAFGDVPTPEQASMLGVA